MQYKYLTKDDLPSLSEFFSQIKNDFQLLRRQQKKQKLENYINSTNKFMLLVIDKDEVIAYESYEINGKKARLIGIGVLKSYRKKGVANRLIKKAIEHMKSCGAKEISSRTWESNTASISLLIKHRFQKYRIMRDDRANGESTVWFRLTKLTK